MFYAVFADTDGDSPEEIGEASWLLARTCFPNDDLNGNSGHTPADVTCKISRYLLFLAPLLTIVSIDIVFTGDDAVLPKSAINNNYVTDFDTLKSMGDEFMADLVNSLGLSGSGGSSTPPSGNQDPSNSNITVTVEIDGVSRKFVPA